MSLVTFTRRTDFPKLGWLMHQLNKKGIKHKLSGRSFHAPVLLVDENDLEKAWHILDPVDELPDDDPVFDTPQWAENNFSANSQGQKEVSTWHH